MRATRKQQSSEWSTASCSRTWPRGNVWPVAIHGSDLLFRNDRCRFAARPSLLLPYGKATDAGAPFTRETLVEIGSCTKTFTTTLFALAINRNQIVPDASAQKYMPTGYTLRAQQLTPLELADLSGMPDNSTNLPRELEQRSIESYGKDFLTWASNYNLGLNCPRLISIPTPESACSATWSRPRPAKLGKIR